MSDGADPHREARERMVADQIVAAGIRDPRVIRAMATVPRHLFVPEAVRAYSYGDSALAVGEGQTISQPYIVAFMTEALGLREGARVLEIGTGSGYQAAILAEIAAEVYSIEIRAGLAERTATVLRELGYRDIRLRRGSGENGWPEAAPFDGVIVTAAPDRVPPALEDQLAVGGNLVIPLGVESQVLHVITREPDGLRDEPVLNVRFVPFNWEEPPRG